MPPSPKARERSDGRQPLLVYMDSDLVLDLKKAALDKNCNAYEIVEAATRDWLQKHPVTASGRKKKPSILGK